MGRCHKALGQSQLHRSQHGLFVGLKNQSDDVDHLGLTAGLAQHLLLQLPKGRRDLGKGRPVAQRTGLALENAKEMPPTIDRPRRQLLATLDDTRIFIKDESRAPDYCQR